MEKTKKRIIICVDIDNDLYEKAKITGPLIGRKANYDAAIKLALADPEEVDSNVIFYGIKLYDELSKDEDIELVTLTGDKNLGIRADREIAEQFERVITHYPASSCIFISDGSSDEEIMPIIRSRVKIDAVKVVVMKQAKELEKTYFVILEKLKDPYYSKIILGIPALIILLYSLAAVLNLKIEYVGIVLGIYLLMKLSGIEERITIFANEFKVSSSKISSVPLILGILTIITILFIAYDTFNQSRRIAYALKVIIDFAPIPVIAAYIAKTIDAYEAKNKLNIIKYARYTFVALWLWAICSTFFQWIINLKGIGELVNIILIAVIFSSIGIAILENLRKKVISNLKLENKEVISAFGGYIGKITGINAKQGTIIIKTPFGHVIEIKINAIAQIKEDRVIVNY